MSGIFLSYRRDDASGWAGRLYEHLVRDWRAGEVFMDIDAIGPGEDFREAIARTMESCGVVLVVIGPGWLNARDEAGNRRLEDEADTHRTEIIAALESDVRVVPVLVGDAVMPRAVELPEPLRALAYRNAAVIEDRRFVGDVAELLNSLREYSGSQGGRGIGARTESRAQRFGLGGGRPRRSATGPGPILTFPTLLALLGATALLIWGALVQREWHNEYAGVRIAAVLILLALVGVAAYVREWRWVLAGGIAGALGLALWTVQLLNSHTDEMGELLSPNQDGIPNIITFAGVLAVLAAGLIGMSRSRHP